MADSFIYSVGCDIHQISIKNKVVAGKQNIHIKLIL